MKNVFLAIAISFLTFGCAQSATKISAKKITEITNNELQSVVLVDVRTPQEFSGGHLENALNINIYDADFEEQFSTIGKEETIYVYCKVGGRSAQAQEKLKALGYENVVNLEGGYDAWKLKH
ncbi:MAG: rhodanese-like domain-containing protein [Flavobacteriaceae bacterium]